MKTRKSIHTFSNETTIMTVPYNTLKYSSREPHTSLTLTLASRRHIYDKSCLASHSSHHITERISSTGVQLTRVHSSNAFHGVLGVYNVIHILSDFDFFILFLLLRKGRTSATDSFSFSLSLPAFFSPFN